MKYLLILIILAVLAFFIYRRVRPYIAIARRLLGILGQMRRMSTPQTSEPLSQPRKTSDRLVRCDSCNTWIPAERAVKLRSSSASYCSHACLEAAAETKIRGKRVKG